MQLCSAFDLGAETTLHLQLDGYAVLANSPLTLFRDGDTILISAEPQTATLPQSTADLSLSSKRKRSNQPLALTGTHHNKLLLQGH